jgi:phosphate transport system permease protein
MEAKHSYTGYSRRRKTSPLVRLGEILSRTFITIGGIGTIVAVAMVCVFLVWVVYPLFLGATVKQQSSFAAPAEVKRPLRTGMDEYQVLGWSLFADGTLQVYRLDNGQVVDRRALFPGRKLTACSTPSREENLAFGFYDGTVQLGRIGFGTRFPEAKEVPTALRDLPIGEIADFDGGILSRTPEGQLRAQKISVKLEEPIKPVEASAVKLIDTSMRPNGAVLSVLTADGKLRISAVTEREDLLTGKKTRELSGGELPLPPRGDGSLPRYLLLSGVGDNVFVVWEDGQFIRVSAQDIDNPKVVENAEFLGQPELSLTAVQFLIGKTTLLVGDSSGRIRTWFRTASPDAATADSAIMTPAHTLAGSGAAVTALAVSGRTRMMAAGYADGSVRLYYVTSEKSLAEVQTQKGQPIQDLAIAPKDDGLLAQTSSNMWRWAVNPGYPEVTLRSLFRPVWYEGYAAPAHVWQSSSGSDEFEPKLGLWPLVFGTLKATFYSLLMGVPLALLAAIYTSEFLHPRTRALVKPTIELMASLPSVVLGFLSALVLAPFVEDVLPAVLACFLTVPGAFLLGAYLWQLLPEKLALRLGRRRFVFICAVLPLGIAAAALLGPGIERLFFHGNFKGWLAGGHGSSTGGWTMLLLPLAGVGVALFLAEVINPRFRRLTGRWGRFPSALADLGKFVLAFLAALTLAWALGGSLNAMGFDPRGKLLGTYVQRNALVVGFIMGFAIIPIIYTIAEDALTAVPEHLRSASLGCGATQWQTAHRIIIPTAMSGLFSAVMIGLGRAVGETMIVLMAAGNTPVMEMNIFNGFRTLSANIAVELPEAVPNSSHYRVLFLAALTLFAMTFVLNTIAEMIRLRFRRRAYQL